MITAFRKYKFIYVLFWQESLSLRATFFMERARSMIVLISFYYFWTALLARQASFAGYDRSQIITYTLGMNVLRSLVFASKTELIPAEINQGRLSAYLLRPVNYCAYAFVRDLAYKSINFVSSLIEVFGLLYLFNMPFQWPHQWTAWALFVVSIGGAMLLNFFMSFTVGCLGFWTSEAWGPRFLLELILEFTAGAFFPIDILSPALQRALHLLPSPYLVFFPLNIFLERLSGRAILEGFGCQLLWIVLAGFFAWSVWKKGVALYAAQGG